MTKTEYKKYVLCGTCNGLGKVEKIFVKEDVREQKSDENKGR